MGIDGAGKTSVAEALVQALRDQGASAEVVSWKRVMAEPGPTAELLALQAMAASRLQLARARVVEKVDVLETLLAEWRPRPFREAEQGLRQLPIDQNEAFPFLSAALIELSGNLFVHHAHIQARRAAGCTVVEESCGFKHVLKNVLMAERLDPDLTQPARQVLALAQALFGGLLRPTQGYWIDTDPGLAEAWRSRSGENATNFEDYSLIGRARGGSFLTMQQDCRQAFAEAQATWGWARLEMTDRPRAQNVAAAVAQIQADLAR
jgi:hypothetical protein